MSQYSKIQLRRGTESNVAGYASSDGELVWGTDSKQAYINGTPMSFYRQPGVTELSIYASPSGVSTNTGLSVASPLPLTDAVAFAKQQNASYLYGGVKINLLTGSYYLGSTLTFDGRTSIQLVGDFATPRNVKLYISGSANGRAGIAVLDGAMLRMSGMQIIPMTAVSSSTNNYDAVVAYRKSVCDIENMVYGEAGKWFSNTINLSGLSMVRCIGSQSFECGAMGNFFNLSNNSMLQFSSNTTVLLNTPAAPRYLTCALNSTTIFYPTCTFSGANSIGLKGSIEQFSSVNLNGVPQATIPGSANFSQAALLSSYF